MQLETLSRHDPKTAQAILAVAALSQEQVPYQSVNAGRFAKEAQELLAEARQFINLQPGDNPEEKLREFLSKQVISAIMGDEDSAAIRDRMGREGRLPLSAYKVNFQRNAMKLAHENEKYIKRMIASASDVQHLTADASPIPDQKGMTLIVVPQDVNTAHEHWLLIDAMRMRDTLFVSDAFRVFPEAVDLSGAKTPRDILLALVDVYGFDFTLEGLPPAKIFEQLTFPKSERDIKYDLGEGDGREISVTGSSFTLTDEAVQRGLPKTTSYIVAAYSFDRKKYLKDRAKYSKR